VNSEAALRAYVHGGYKTVQGWLDPTAVEAVILLSRTQAELGISGGVSEIGIHHGRLFILLHLLRRGDERSAAYDLFEMQDANVDASGLGDKATFLDNLRRHGGDTERIVVKSRNSLDMTAAEVRADAGPVRLFSVDGGHTADITASDLALAEGSLCPGGIVILDDYFNESWPGVSEGAARYLSAGASKLVPVAIGGNKFMLTNSDELAAKYREALRALPDRYVVADQTVFGMPVLVVRAKVVTLRTRVAATSLWKQIKGTTAGRALKAAALRVLPP
jgi:Methyltransferase domain